MIGFFKVILYQPLLNLLVFFYNVIPGHNLGVAIILLTLVIKIILLPFSLQSVKAQKSFKELQPKLNEIKEKYANQKEKQAQAMLSLYKEHKVSPFSSCLPLLIQLPVLIVVFQVFRVGLTDASLPIYSFLFNPGILNITAFGFLNLSQASPFLAFVTAVLQYWQMQALSTKQVDKKMVLEKGAKDENMMAMMNKQMKFMMPILTFFIGFTMPSGLMLYWLVSLLFSVGEQKIIFNYSQKINHS